ncbi:hypothetical protein NAEGRDRAFT_61798 [Naegleria gruberi]|uniref:Uncharacterized protein AM36 n=1 Tax=Naegleria gruberi TaxID=5762 RepID=D2UZ36_NAEGR|nr:uncharacterized protein NAEGRDRAFT_61798 [Naegleria gruberi]EFC49877.1 hypothetical protein NAEGRDRAFT_61798 [Naegleria gruberi]|eukprot:XP_002682621.1 hypothetical protein NAEGRDRAFT_61798 [Naegleria gruberi strain NEG-M]
MSLYHHHKTQTVYVLLRTVMRAFYDPVHAVVMDALLHYQTSQLDEVKESELAKKVNLQPSVVKKALLELYSDLLLTKEERATERKKGQKKYPSRSETYWRVDYEQCINAIRYKMYLLSLEVKKKVQADPTYTCTVCDEEYEAYDVTRLLDFATGTLICQTCGGQVDESRESLEKHEETISGSDSLEVRYNNQLQLIIEKLNECKAYVVPKEYRWNYKHIVTKEEADRKIEEQRKAIEREKSMGSHRPVSTISRNTQSNNLGATAHVAKASALSSSSYISLDPSANIKIDFVEERGIIDDDSDAHIQNNPVQKKPDNPFFLKQTVSSREYNDYNQANDVEDDDDHIISSKDREIDTSVYHELLEREAAENAKSEKMVDEFEAIDEGVMDNMITDTNEFESVTNFEQDNGMDGNNNEPMIFVAGVPVPYSQITPEHESAMTELEYEEYDRIKAEQEQIYDF